MFLNNKMKLSPKKAKVWQSASKRVKRRSGRKLYCRRTRPYKDNKKCSRKRKSPRLISKRKSKRKSKRISKRKFFDGGLTYVELEEKCLVLSGKKNSDILNELNTYDKDDIDLILFISCIFNYTNIFIVIISISKCKNVDFNFMHNHMTPLFIAAQNGHTRIVQLLIKHVELDKVCKDGATPLFIAAQNGHTGIVELLLGKGADVNKQRFSGTTPLYIAAQNGHTGIVELLLGKGANFDKAKNDGVTPLYIAAEKGHIEIVNLLISKGADVDIANNNGVTPLNIAVQNGHTGIVELLLGKGANFDKERNDGSTPLFIAAQNGHIDIVELLISEGATVDKERNDGVTPLFIASQQGHIEIVELLISKGATVDKADNKGVTPLFIAAHKGHIEIVNLLISKGANVNKATINQRTPLFIACNQRHGTIVNLLLKNNADINIIDKFSYTPLSIAVINNYYEIVCDLLDYDDKIIDSILISKKNPISEVDSISTELISNKFIKICKNSDVDALIEYQSVIDKIEDKYSKDVLNQIINDVLLNSKTSSKSESKQPIKYDESIVKIKTHKAKDEKDKLLENIKLIKNREPHEEVDHLVIQFFNNKDRDDKDYKLKIGVHGLWKSLISSPPIGKEINDIKSLSSLLGSKDDDGFEIINPQKCMITLDSGFIMYEWNKHGIYFSDNVKLFYDKVCTLASPIIEYLNNIAFKKIKPIDNETIWNAIRTDLKILKNIITEPGIINKKFSDAIKTIQPINPSEKSFEVLEIKFKVVSRENFFLCE